MYLSINVNATRTLADQKLGLLHHVSFSTLGAACLCYIKYSCLSISERPVQKDRCEQWCRLGTDALTSSKSLRWKLSSANRVSVWHSNGRGRASLGHSCSCVCLRPTRCSYCLKISQQTLSRIYLQLYFLTSISTQRLKSYTTEDNWLHTRFSVLIMFTESGNHCVDAVFMMSH